MNICKERCFYYTLIRKYYHFMLLKKFIFFTWSLKYFWRCRDTVVVSHRTLCQTRRKRTLPNFPELHQIEIVAIATSAMQWSHHFCLPKQRMGSYQCWALVAPIRKSHFSPFIYSSIASLVENVLTASHISLINAHFSLITPSYLIMNLTLMKL